MVRGTINQHQEVIQVISINFQAKTARVRCGSGVGFDNYQRSGVDSYNCRGSRLHAKHINKSYQSSLSTFKQKQQWSGMGPGLILIIVKGPGLILIIAKGLGYLKTTSRSHTSHLYQLSSKNSNGPGWVQG